MRPRLIRSELGEGASTWVPYGISVDVTEWERELRERAEQIVERWKQNRQATRSPPPRRKK